MAFRASNTQDTTLTQVSGFAGLAALDGHPEMLPSQYAQADVRKYPFVWTVLGLLIFCGAFWFGVYMLFFAR